MTSEGRTSEWLDVATNVVLIVVALVMAGVSLSSRWNSRPSPPQPPTVPDDWESEMLRGIVVGPPNASIKILEFIDFECPACRGWMLRIDSLRAEFPNDVRVSVHHTPNVSGHPNSMSAAVAAECADEQGMFESFSTTVMRDQVLLGEREWVRFADEAGVPDLPEFEECRARPPSSFGRIQYGLELAARVGIRGTPTVWINGQQRRPSLDELRSLVIELSSVQEAMDEPGR